MSGPPDVAALLREALSLPAPARLKLAAELLELILTTRRRPDRQEGIESFVVAISAARKRRWRGGVSGPVDQMRALNLPWLTPGRSQFRKLVDRAGIEPATS